LIQSDNPSIELFPTPGRLYIWRTPKKAYNLAHLVPTVKHREGSVMAWTAIISWYSVGPIITLHGQITAREYVDRLDNQVQSWFEKHKGELQHLPWPAQSPDLNITEQLWSVWGLE
jgi:hypothetical protein